MSTAAADAILSVQPVQPVQAGEGDEAGGGGVQAGQAAGHRVRAGSDFVEGVRAVLVDRDRAQRLATTSLDDVSRAEVEQIFGGSRP